MRDNERERKRWLVIRVDVGTFPDLKFHSRTSPQRDKTWTKQNIKKQQFPDQRKQNKTSSGTTTTWCQKSRQSLAAVAAARMGFASRFPPSASAASSSRSEPAASSSEPSGVDLFQSCFRICRQQRGRSIIVGWICFGLINWLSSKLKNFFSIQA